MSTLLKYGFLSITMLLCACSKPKKDKLFRTISSVQSGIYFSNTLSSKNNQNIIQNLYYYNGGGVAIGDINNDTLPDIYFTSNQEANKLYLNKGDLKFIDISEAALPGYTEDWSTGVTMADVNNDGWLDIYTSSVSGYKGYKGSNRLLLNNGDLTFEEHSAEAGLDLEVYGTQAAFFDYDKDGDLDIYMLCHSFKSPEVFRDTSIRRIRDMKAGDRLMKNQLIETGELTFIDVTESSKIYSSAVGFGLGISISDINNDGWSDIYVGNDFHENDYVYLNNQDGTFTESSAILLQHGSTFSMGNDIADINNDGLLDIMTLDMKPEDRSVFQNSTGVDPYEVYNYKLGFGYDPQFSQNCLFLNRGKNRFSEIANAAGVAATDWSWSVLLEDFDMDGQKDMFISNGIGRRPNDQDYLNYISSDIAQTEYSDDQLSDAMPKGDWMNYFYRNIGDAQFEKVTKEWSNMAPDLSTGAAVADLDLDGDLDIVSNRIGQEALLLENTSEGLHYLTIDVAPQDRSAFLGSKITLQVNDQVIVKEIKSNRGFQSSSEAIAHFGLGNAKMIDRVIIGWPNGNIRQLENIPSNQKIYITPFSDSIEVSFEDECHHLVARELPIIHKEDRFTDFTYQKLLPFSAATQGPAMAIGDINGDEIDDVYLGNAKGQIDQIYFAQTIGDFGAGIYLNKTFINHADVVDVALVDIDSDGDLDVVRLFGGGHQSTSQDNGLGDIWINTSGAFILQSTLPISGSFNGGQLATADYDLDGDVDLFIGLESKVHQYGQDSKSWILLNDGSGNFNNRHSVALDLGMVSDANNVDLNKDGRPDLIIASAWRDIQIVFNRESGFDIQVIPNSSGLWRSVVSDDLNGDGVIDIVAGNIGMNLPIHASEKYPLTLFVDDFNGNGSTEPILAQYENDRLYPYENRDNLSSQIPQIKRKYPDYKSFAQADVYDIFGDNLKNALRKEVVTTRSMIFLGQADGTYKAKELPINAQYSCINAIHIQDMNGDGLKDILTGGNLYAITPSLGRLDGSYLDLQLQDIDGNFYQEKCSSFPKLNGQLRAIRTINKTDIILGFNDDVAQLISIK